MINLFSNGLSNRRKLHDVLWFFSGAGKASYLSCNTIERKIYYYYYYLKAVRYKDDQSSYDSKSYDQTLYRLAFIIADSIDGSTLPCCEWPNILSAEENPLVSVVASLTKYGYLSGLDVFEKFTDYKKQIIKTKQLTVQNMQDLYVVEKYIVWLLCNDLGSSKTTLYKTHSECIN